MALTIPSQIFGTVAFALNTYAQPDVKTKISRGPIRLDYGKQHSKFNKMKKIFTLGLGLMFTVAMFAADRRPTVTVTSARTFEIVIDGRHYAPNYSNTVSISNLFNGSHNIQVYQVRPGFLMRSKRLVASSSFQLRNSDVQINVDRFGQLQIMQSRFGRDWNDRDRDGYGQQDGRGYGQQNGRGYDQHDGRDHNRRF